MITDWGWFPCIDAVEIAGKGDHCRDSQPLRPRSHGAGGWVLALRDRGTDLIAADSPNAFLDETPTAVMIRLLTARNSGRVVKKSNDLGRGRAPKDIDFV